MIDWRPIDTAPRTFAPILTFVPGPMFGPIKEGPDEYRIAFWKRDGWRCQQDDHLILEPTHWAPLNPPEGA